MKKTMTIISITISICCVFFFITTTATTQQTKDNPQSTEQIHRGKELTTLMGCNDCHTPKIYTTDGFVLDESRLLSGHPSEIKLPEIPTDFIGNGKWYGLYSKDLTAWAGPWGVSYATNLTPDNKTGIGRWTAQNFISTIRLGIHAGLAREISPPMPWKDISKLNDDDLKSIYIYLRTLKPVQNAVPSSETLREEIIKKK